LEKEKSELGDTSEKEQKKLLKNIEDLEKEKIENLALLEKQKEEVHLRDVQITETSIKLVGAQHQIEKLQQQNSSLQQIMQENEDNYKKRLTKEIEHTQFLQKRVEEGSNDSNELRQKFQQEFTQRSDLAKQLEEEKRRVRELTDFSEKKKQEIVDLDKTVKENNEKIRTLNSQLYSLLEARRIFLESTANIII